MNGFIKLNGPIWAKMQRLAQKRCRHMSKILPSYSSVIQNSLSIPDFNISLINKVQSKLNENNSRNTYTDKCTEWLILYHTSSSAGADAVFDGLLLEEVGKRKHCLDLAKVVLSEGSGKCTTFIILHIAVQE